jgi:hypothetical protein
MAAAVAAAMAAAGGGGRGVAVGRVWGAGNGTVAVGGHRLCRVYCAAAMALSAAQADGIPDPTAAPA